MQELRRNAGSDPFAEGDGASRLQFKGGVDDCSLPQASLRAAYRSKTSLSLPSRSTGSGTANTSAGSLVDPLLLRRSAKAIPPIQVPPSFSKAGSRSPAMRSSTLTDSFPLPPPRTPLTPSTTTQGSHIVPESPQVHLSVPPPSPYASASKRSTLASGHWDAELSSLRSQAGHPGHGGSTQQSSPVGTPGANQAYMPRPRQSKGDRIQSYIAELSAASPLDSPISGPSTYPPQAYSPDVGHGLNRKGSLGPPVQPYNARRDSAGTFVCSKNTDQRP